jgi:hypothetical protein
VSGFCQKGGYHDIPLLHHLYIPVLLLREEPEDWFGGALGE